MKNLLLLSTLIMAFGAFAQEHPKPRIEVTYYSYPNNSKIDTSTKEGLEDVEQFLAVKGKEERKACATAFAEFGESVPVLADPFVSEVREYAILKGLSDKDMEDIEMRIKHHFYARPTLRFKVDSKWFALSRTDVFAKEIEWGSYARLASRNCSDLKEKFETMGALKVSDIKEKIDELSYRMPSGFGAAPAQDDSSRENQKDFIDGLFSAPVGSQVQDA